VIESDVLDCKESSLSKDNFNSVSADAGLTLETLDDGSWITPTVGGRAGGMGNDSDSSVKAGLESRD